MSLALAAAVACEPDPGPHACYGVCGEGTRCASGTCVVNPPETTPAPPQNRRSKRRRRGRGPKRSSAAQDADRLDWTPEDDSHVPGYDPGATRALDLNAGTERLGDRTVQQHLRRLEPEFNRCIEASARAAEGAILGTLDFTFSIEPSGKVSGVDARGTPKLRDSGVIPCARNVVYKHRFPSFDGSTMAVDYSFHVR